MFLYFFERLLLLSSDIETQSGPNFNDSFFSYVIGTSILLVKTIFKGFLSLKHNTIFKYDIISLCETSLNDATKVPANILEGYQFFSLNHPSGDKKGGVGIFYKEFLPLKIRHDLSFQECIVTVLYRNLIHKVDTPEFGNFVQNILKYFIRKSLTRTLIPFYWRF